jgi:hypothetical protein
MPVKRLHQHDHPLAVGDYYLHRVSGYLVEIMDVDPSGHCSVLDVTAPLDAAWRRLTSPISCCTWQRVERSAQAA